MGDSEAMAAAGNGPTPAGLTPERWQQVKGLLAAALEIHPAQRSAYLDKVCAGDPTLRAELDELLAVEQVADPEPLNTSAIVAAFEEGPGAHARVGRRIGPYQIVEEIGVGGMGEVYRAFRADEQYHKQVAIKLVRAGQDSRFVVARFKNERQVLASLDHPNIARLLDGGTTEDGVPYFVMELIEGQPIHDYCDDHKLPTAERLKLFRQVCSAVQYAHQRLIVHRDLKPSNILVTQEGIPMLLDFGIAKILDPTAVSETLEPTMSMFRLLTPGYASPEQIKGETITTASDVYSLGVLLYELLTGRRPYQIVGHAPHEIARAVCESEPERPSAVLWRTDSHEAVHGSIEITPSSVSAVRDGSAEKLSRRLRGDLDNIILMALRKDSQRRYASAEQFAEDIRRHLENLPVSARTDSVRYRMSKFIRRHTAGAAATVIVAVAVLAGLGTTLYEAHIARVQQLRAEQRFNDVRALANSLMFDVHDSIQDLPGSTAARKLLVEKALRYLDSLSRDAASDASLRRELAVAYEKVGTVQGNPFGGNVGDTQGALKSYRKSLAIWDILVKDGPVNLDDHVAHVRLQRLIGAVMANRADPGSIDMMKQAVASAEQLRQSAPSAPAVMAELAIVYRTLGALLDGIGDYQSAAEAYTKAKPIVEQLVLAAPNDRIRRRDLASTEARIGHELAAVGAQEDSFGHFQSAIELFQSITQDGTDSESSRRLGNTHYWLADALEMKRDTQGALRHHREQHRIMLRLAAKDPNNAVVQYDLACGTARLGNATALTGQIAAGLEQLDRSAKMLEAQSARDPDYSEPRYCLAAALVWRGETYDRTGSVAKAVENYERGLAIWQELATRYKGTGVEANAALMHAHIGAALVKQRRFSQAGEHFDQARRIAEPTTMTNFRILDAQYAIADTYSGLGNLSRMLGYDAHRTIAQRIDSLREANRYYQRSLEAWGKIHNPGSRSPVGFTCGSPKKVTQQLAKCDAALAKLKSLN